MLCLRILQMKNHSTRKNISNRIHLHQSRQLDSLYLYRHLHRDHPAPRSTFLPTLMGGYWSGSESPASDLSDSAVRPPVRKNRRGQQARRALAEKKFGTGANHIKAGKPSVNIKEEKGKDKGRKRGEKFANDRGRGRGRDVKDNANLTEVKPREKTRDDVGVLHPSWQAAKKAKEEKLKATFQGKKVTFD
ncbi:hypothetical protein CJF30_00007979 [Rutstroemia sp. NJR-2017a BBW]|nr:hypothetical protein CJF30_00007979 [Rutstroemia sp. NJR-2017a BBW]